ncbi:MAG: hypothetical protein HY258_13075 [Chloroflexi bacterium]|nr:hypothetical protein [Chloroflexota bacterium]
MDKMTAMEEETEQTYTAKTACGGGLKDTTGKPSAIYRGQRVYFCTRACLRVFEQDPDPFMAGEIEHPLEDDPDASN